MGGHRHRRRGAPASGVSTLLLFFSIVAGGVLLRGSPVRGDENSVSLSFDPDEPAKCNVNPTGRTFRAETVVVSSAGPAEGDDCAEGEEGAGSRCHKIQWMLGYDDDTGTLSRYVTMNTCPGRLDVNITSSFSSSDDDLSTATAGSSPLTSEERAFLCKTASTVEDRVEPEALRDHVDSLESQVVRGSRLLCLWPDGLPVTYAARTDANKAVGDGRDLKFVVASVAPPREITRKKRNRRRRTAAHASEETSGSIRPLCHHIGEYLASSDDKALARIGKPGGDPPCGDTVRGMYVHDGDNSGGGEGWVCRERSSDDDGVPPPPLYGEPNPPAWSEGDCFGRCGDGCDTSPGYMAVTADCADLDFCRRFGIAEEADGGGCRTLFLNAVDDWMFALGGDGKCEEVATTVTTEPTEPVLVEVTEPTEVIDTGEVVIDEPLLIAPRCLGCWWGWPRHPSDHDFVDYGTLQGIGAPDTFAGCEDLRNALTNAAKYVVNQAVKNNANYGTSDDAFRMCDPAAYYGWEDQPWRTDGDIMFAPTMMADESSASAVSGGDLSGLDDSFETNAQERGVSEGDLIKSDGNIIAAAYGSSIFLFDVATLEVRAQWTYEYDADAGILSSVLVENPTVDMFYPEEAAAAGSNGTNDTRTRTRLRHRRDLSVAMPYDPYYEQQTRPPSISALLLEPHSSPNGGRLTVILQVHPKYKDDDDLNKTILNEDPTTIVRVYDVTGGDPPPPNLIGSKTVGGSYISLRGIGTSGHLVTSSWIDRSHYLTDFFGRCRDEYITQVYNETDNTTTRVYMNDEEYLDAVLPKVDQYVNSYVARLEDELTVDGTCDTIVRITTFDSTSGDEPDPVGGDDDSAPYEDHVQVLQNFIRITSFNIHQDPAEPIDDGGAAAPEEDISGGPPLVTDRAGVFVPGSTSYTYASRDVLVVPMWGNDLDPTTGRWRSSTLLYSFDLRDDASAATPRGVAKVNGTTTMQGSLNQFAFDEYDGHLRVATTNQAEWACIPNVNDDGCTWGQLVESFSQVTVLKLPEADSGSSSVMEVVSVIDDLGPREQIFAVRFMDQKAFVVTFERTDPFYSIDFSEGYVDPPVGELADITGFSNYLHPFDPDGNIVLGVGQEATLEGRAQGLMISLFNVTDLRQPALMHKYHEGVGASSDAQSDHRALRFIPRNDNDSGVLILPVHKWTDTYEGNHDGFTLYDVSIERGITPLLNVTHGANEEFFYCWSRNAYLPARSFVVDGHLVTTKKRSLVRTDLSAEEWEVKVNMEKDLNTGCWYWW